MEFVMGQVWNYKRATSPRGSGVGGRGVSADSRTIAGICSVFGNADAGGDVVVPGAFKKAVEDFNAGRSRARFLWNHDSSEPPIARIVELKEIPAAQLPAAIRNQGGVNGALQVTRQYFDDAFSERVYQGVTSKAITEMSFAYNILDFEYSNVKGQKVRLLKALELMDCSDVNWGMNPLTSATLPKNAVVLTVAKIKQMKERHHSERVRAEVLAQMKYDARHSSKVIPMGDLELQLADFKLRSARMRQRALGAK